MWVNASFAFVTTPWRRATPEGHGHSIAVARTRLLCSFRVLKPLASFTERGPYANTRTRSLNDDLPKFPPLPFRRFPWRDVSFYASTIALHAHSFRNVSLQRFYNCWVYTAYRCRDRLMRCWRTAAERSLGARDGYVRLIGKSEIVKPLITVETPAVRRVWFSPRTKRNWNLCF